MTNPLVSCIMPTADREKYVPYAIKYFLAQDYANKELIIMDDGQHSVKHLIPHNDCIHYMYNNQQKSIGLKRNLACDQANGEIIVHWDDDDWHATDWISAEVYFLTTYNADLTGMQHIYYYSAPDNKLYWVKRTYKDGSNPLNWVHGATLAYWKSFWFANPFKDLSQGEDDDFIQTSKAKLKVHDYKDGYVCILHPHNTVIRSFENLKFKLTC
jgi:glycosyltransferase involved in cell wall biosynthesis